jgi:hypothetical protein
LCQHGGAVWFDCDAFRVVLFVMCSVCASSVSAAAPPDTHSNLPHSPPLQAQRAALDMTRARDDLDREQAANAVAWDAGATERSRALSLHASEAGRHTLEGRLRVAAAEASLAWSKRDST